MTKEVKKIYSATDAERIVIASCISSRKARDIAAKMLKSDMFYDVVLKGVFDKIFLCCTEDDLVDISALSYGCSFDCQNVISELVDSVSYIDITLYASDIALAYARRECYSALHSAIKRIDMGKDVVGVCGCVEDVLVSMRSHASIGTQSIKESMPLMMAEIEKSVLGETKPIKTGIKSIDTIEGFGFYPKDFWVVGARPSHGKTAFILQLAYDCAKKNIPSLIISLEMTKTQLLKRFVSSITGITTDNIRSGELSKKQLTDIAVASGELSALPIHINDCNLDAYEISSVVRGYVKSHGIKIVFIDYLQLIKDSKNHKEIRHLTSEKSAVLMNLAKECEIPIVSLAQLGRGVESRPDKKPSLIDLRESGNIEQDACGVMLLWRPKRFGIGNDDSESYISIAKIREGCVGLASLNFDGARGRFSDRLDTM